MHLRVPSSVTVPGILRAAKRRRQDENASVSKAVSESPTKRRAVTIAASQNNLDSQTETPSSQVYNPDDFDRHIDSPTFDEHSNQVGKFESESDSEELLRFRAGLPPASQPVELAEPVFTVTKLEELECKIDVIEDGSVKGDRIKEEEEEEESEDEDLFGKCQSCGTESGEIPLPTRVVRLQGKGYTVPSSWNSAGAICKKCGNRFRTYRRSLVPNGKETEREMTRKMKNGERAGKNKTPDYDWYAWVDPFGMVIRIWPRSASRRNVISDISEPICVTPHRTPPKA
ncbi:hypothetical protein C8J56DRAFT_479975 [Mycena floridula]|nr:hypothetical protein C8J56DRAFT_479975 [Mycena floridula]